MIGNNRHASGNRLLARLSEQGETVLDSHFEAIKCPLRMVLALPGEAISHVHFLDEGIASVVAKSPEGLSVEAGFIGREGFVVPGVALETNTTPHLCQMQVAGFGRRVSAAKFREAMDVSPPLRTLCLRFAQVALVQTGCTALSNAVHQIDERLARWLLMCHDRSSSDDMALTHEFMSVMLAVRRPTVTTALHVLEGNGFIRSDRGYVQIIDRAAMETFAGDSYGTPEEEYRRLIGPF